MAKQKKVIIEATGGVDPSIVAMKQFMKANKDSFIHQEDFVDWRCSTGSLLFDEAIGGGFGPGVFKVGGSSKGGKTHFILHCVKQGIESLENCKGMYFDAEGRLTEKIQKQCGIKFVHSPDEWVAGTCWLLVPEDYEVVTSQIDTLIRAEKQKKKEDRCKYFFVVDSLDCLIKKADLAKPMGEAGQVAGGALIMSVFFKKTNRVMNKLGHALFLVAQIRSEIQINQYEEQNQNKGVGGGGAHAVIHAANHIWDFKARPKKLEIFDSKKKKIGHYCKVLLKKSEREETNIPVEFPIKYGRKDGDSIWVEYEIADILLGWDLIEASGSWLTFSKDLIEDLNKQGEEIPEKFAIQGVDKLRAWLEENPKITKYLYNKFLGNNEE